MMEMTGVEESVQVMRLILELFDRAFDKSFVIAGKTLELAGKIKDKGKDVAKVSSAFLYKKYKEAKAKKEGKLAPGEQNVSRLLDVLSDRKITPLFMQLDRKSLESFRSYVAENNLTYAFLPDLNTEDEFIEIVYPATEPNRTLFDVYMDKNKETAKPYTFSQYTENAREEDINNVKREVGEEYEKMDAAFRSAEVMEEAIKTGRLVISKEQLIKEAADTYKVELTDNDGKACFLLVASDKVIIDGDTSKVIIQLDKEKMMLVQYPDRMDITIDKNSLLEDETSNKYFTKVPGSKGQKFIFIDKKDAEEIYDGKTIKTKLVPDEEYEICDRDGNVTSKMRGDELYKEHYDKVATPLEDIVKMNINYAEMKKAKARSEEEDKEVDKSDKKEEEADTTKENTDVDMPEQKESDKKLEPADEKTETASKEHNFIEYDKLDEKMKKKVNSFYAFDRAAAAKQGYGLDKLITDEDWKVRATVAGQGYGLDKLITDENEFVRAAVARQGYGLDKLITDEDWKVRAAVAKQAYGLDKLITDEDWKVREAVAKQGYGLDKLISDKVWDVRAAVAEQGYGLDKLINDEDWGVRAAVAEQGYGLDKLINDEDWGVRAAVAEQGYELDKLINDEAWQVRAAVARQGYGLDKLINDKNGQVRSAAMTASKKQKEHGKQSEPSYTGEKSRHDMSSDNKSNNAFVEVIPSQITRNDSKSVKVHLQEGDLYVYQSSVIKSEGHVFVCLNENKQYKLFDEGGKMSEKVYSASEIMTQIIDYATENKTPEEYRKRQEERSKDNGEHDRSKRSRPNR